MRVELHPAAERELGEAADYYGAISPRLRDGFALEVARAVNLLRVFPALGAPLASRAGLRRFVIDRFPYAIVYASGKVLIVTLAFAHHARRPDYWQNR